MLPKPPASRLNALLPLWETLLGFFYPNLCQICIANRTTASDGYVCAKCWSRPDGIEFIIPPYCHVCGLPFAGDITNSFECGNCRDERLYFRSARAAVRFSGLVQEVIHRYKYQESLWFEPFLADLLLRQAKPALESTSYDMIVPIPLHWSKRQFRSFNQADALAGALSKTAGVPVNKRSLRRVIPTSTQTRLTRAERIENVRKAFVYTGRRELAGEKIVLIDDVLTTGATANACAKVLMQNGASLVDVWTVARGTLQ